MLTKSPFGGQEWVRLADGSCWDRRNLYFAALQLDPSYAVLASSLLLGKADKAQQRAECFETPMKALCHYAFRWPSTT